MYIYANEFLNMKTNRINRDKAADKRKQKILKMKRKNEELRQKEKRAIEKKKMALMKKSNKEKKKQEKRRRAYNRNNEKQMANNKRKMSKKDMNTKNREIKKPKTISNTRLTRPKKRMLLKRIMLQSQYSRGDFDFVKEYYKDITKEEILLYKNSDDRIYYREVQAYEDARDDVTVRRGWTAFKLGLAATMLTLSINALKSTIQDIQNINSQQTIETSLEDASQEQKDKAIMDIELLEVSCGYEFEHLTQDEKIQAMLNIPVIESNMSEMEFQGAIINLKDQELLDEIAIEVFGREYNTYSDEKKLDLKKLAYELLDENKRDYSRDPQKLKEIKEKNEAETAVREENNRNLNTDEEYDDR